MSFLSPEQTAYKDGPNLDAFGRLRVSQGVQLFGLAQEYSNHPLIWDNYTASGGTVTYNSTSVTSLLSTAGSTSGARALYQTKVYHRYTPGKSQLIRMTGVLRAGATPSGAAFAGIGYYDDGNGIFFKDSAAGVAVVERTNTSGSAVDTAVLQASWNIDRFDGTGPSGKTVDWTKGQIFMIDLQWLGAGRVRYGLVIDGVTYYCHQSVHANMLVLPYMATACLPLRYEVFNSGGAGSNISVRANCVSVDSEGGVNDESVYPFSYSTYISTPMTLDTTLRPVQTRRLRDTFNGKTTHGKSTLRSLGLLVKTNDVYWEIRYNQTITLGSGGSTATSDVDSSYSISEYDTYVGAANTVSGGVLMYSGIAPAGGGTGANVIAALSSANLSNTVFKLGRTYNNVRDAYTLSARAMTGTATLSTSVQIEETY